jgi:hypothetical protein
MALHASVSQGLISPGFLNICRFYSVLLYSNIQIKKILFMKTPQLPLTNLYVSAYQGGYQKFPVAEYYIHTVHTVHTSTK